jgi:cytochrome c6
MLSSGCGSGALDARLVAGRALYVANCAACHQENGSGYQRVYPRLAGNRVVRLPDASPTLTYVLDGRGSMPPFRDQLTKVQIADIVSYVREAWGNDASPVSPAEAG